MNNRKKINHALGLITWELRQPKSPPLYFIVEKTDLSEKALSLLAGMLKYLGKTLNEIKLLSQDQALKEHHAGLFITLGTETSQKLLQNQTHLDALRLNIHTAHSLSVIPTYHPDELLQHPLNKQKALEDLNFIRQHGLN